MVDWSGHAGQTTTRRYRSMAERQLRGISPSYERLCLGVADDVELMGRLDTLPPPNRQPNLLLATVRFLDGPVDSYPAFRSFVYERWAEVSATMLARRTQTNEPRRCATLLPALAALPQPLALLEVGAAAGLCLYPDRYAYRYDARPVVGSAPLVLDCATTGPVPFPRDVPQVAWRAGLDLHPLDIRDDDDVRWLRSLIWPEQADRFTVLDKAVAIARVDSAPIVEGDLLSDTARLGRQAPPDATLVVYHSAVLAYLPEERRSEFRAQIAELARERRTIWLANEGPKVVVDVPVPDGFVPFVLSRDGAALATADPHGGWLNWLG
jgi:hypothetical protein